MSDVYHAVRVGFSARSIVSGADVLLATCRGRREGWTSEVSDCPPEVNVLVAELDGSPRVTIGFDLAWVDQKFCRELRERLWAKDERLEPSQVFIAATHTHSAPQVAGGIGHYGELDEDFRSFVLATTLECVAEALAKVSGWKMEGPRAFEHSLPIINRKKRALSGEWFPGANAKRYSPSIGRVTALRSEAGDVGFVMVQLSCHPVFEKRNRLCADFPGVMRRHLRTKYGSDVTVIFLQGFSGDVRPDFRSRPRGKELIKQTLRFGWPVATFTNAIDDRMEEFGKTLAERAVGALESDSAVTFAELPSAEIRSVAVASSGGKRDNCIEVWGFNSLPGVRLIGVSGETFAGFGREFDEPHSANVRASHWPVGLANGLWGYLPDRALIEAKSGYEYTCWKLFGHDGPLGDEYVGELSGAIREVAALSA